MHAAAEEAPAVEEAREDEEREGGDGEELYLSKHVEWNALQWLEAFLPGGSQIACAKAEMERKGLSSTSLHYAVRSPSGRWPSQRCVSSPPVTTPSVLKFARLSGLRCCRRST